MSPDPPQALSGCRGSRPPAKPRTTSADTIISPPDRHSRRFFRKPGQRLGARDLDRRTIPTQKPPRAAWTGPPLSRTGSTPNSPSSAQRSRFNRRKRVRFNRP